MSEWRDSRVNIRHMLENFVDTYNEEYYEILINESIANALDANATIIKLYLNNNNFFFVEDNGNGMSEDEFEKYHDLNYSLKRKGSGIGFAGIGAKLYLLKGKKILTETRSDYFHKASEMELVNDKVRWRYLDEMPFGLTHKGTIYGVTLPIDDANNINNNIDNILWRNYSSIILGIYGNYSIIFNNKRIKLPDYITKEHFTKFEFKMRDAESKGNMSIRIYINLSGKALPKEEQGFAIIVHGKTIKRTFLDIEYYIKPDFKDRINGYIIADGLAILLNTNKADFLTRNNPRLWASFKTKSVKHIKDWLKKNNLYNEDFDRRYRETTKRTIEKDIETVLVKALSNPSLRQYNPFLAKRQVIMTTIPDEDGDVNIQLKDGFEKVSGNKRGPTNGKDVNIDGLEDGKGWHRNEQGEKRGSDIPRSRRGININIRPLSDEEIEYIASDEAIIVNENNPTYRKCQRLGNSCETLNAYRCVVMALLEYNQTEDGKNVLKALSNFFKIWGIS